MIFQSDFFRCSCLCTQFFTSMLCVNHNQLQELGISCVCDNGHLKNVFIARILSYSTNTWFSYKNTLEKFAQFAIAEKEKFSNNAIMKYLMKLINIGATVDSINLFFTAVKFLVKFLNLKIVSVKK